MSQRWCLWTRDRDEESELASALKPGDALLVRRWTWRGRTFSGGSAGCFILDNQGRRYALTAAHVLEGAVGGRVYDSAGNVVGRVAARVRHLEAALVMLSTTVQCTNTVDATHRIAGIADLRTPDDGWMSGATTGLIEVSIREALYEAVVWPYHRAGSPTAKAHGEALRRLLTRVGLTREVRAGTFFAPRSTGLSGGNSGSVFVSDDGLARSLVIRGDHRSVFLGVDLAVIATTLGVRLL